MLTRQPRQPALTKESFLCRGTSCRTEEMCTIGRAAVIKRHLAAKGAVLSSCFSQ